jgi:proteasome assembly chaperone (PAC2) family protein
MLAIWQIEWLKFHREFDGCNRSRRPGWTRAGTEVMGKELLTFYDHPKLNDARLILGFSGWMDGGDVSTGTIDYLVDKLGARKLAEIDPGPFYLYNFPGSMDIASLFRPHVKIDNGLITEFEEAPSAFYADATHNVILFKGKEPNLRWRDYAECICAVVADFRVTTACFVGSVAGLAPHTREPRIFGSVSEEDLMPLLQRFGLTPSNYEGPASFVTYLTTLAKSRQFRMMALVAEIPAYVQAKNLKSMAAVVRKLAAILGLAIDLGDLRTMTREFEKRLNATVQEHPELAEQIRKIEQDYDKQVFDTSTDADLKAWLEKQGIRLD